MLDVDEVPNGQGWPSQVCDNTPLTGLLEDQPIKDMSVAKQLVQFIRAEATNQGGGRVGDKLRRQRPGAGGRGGCGGCRVTAEAGTKGKALKARGRRGGQTGK